MIGIVIEARPFADVDAIIDQHFNNPIDQIIM